MTDTLRVAAVQFETAENDKAGNLASMSRLVDAAAAKGAEVISFPELCTTGYHFLTQLSKEELLGIAERVSDGPTVRSVCEKARRSGRAILFGMLERGEGERMYNTYVAVTPDGIRAAHRKLHAFENSAILQGDRLETFELLGWTCGILTCYDNNLPENTRVLALKGAEIIFAPHQTGGFDIKRAGMGRIPLKLWRRRHVDPAAMRQAIMGPKGREWIVKWLPSRSYDNNVFTVFANGVGADGPEVRVGCSMIIDPEGVILAETTAAEDDFAIAALSRSARVDSLPASHMAARRPSLYGKICEPVEEVDTRTIRNRVSGQTIR